MADYTVISNANVEPDAPFISATAFALRDNPIAIAEGAAGAPRIVNAAVTDGTLGSEKFQSGTNETNWVLGRNAGASVGAVGTYAFLATLDTGFEEISPGEVESGSSLFYVGIQGRSTQVDEFHISSSNPSGSWRCMGFTERATNGSDIYGATLWLRIS